MVKKIPLGLWVVVVIFILAFGGIWYAIKKPAAEKESIKIGAILPLTGSMSYVGEELKNGISMAVKDINAKNERKIEIIFEDSKMDPKEGVAAINKLIDFDKVNYVYIFGTPIIIAAKPITESKKIILAGGSISPAILENSNYTLRIFYNLDQALGKFTEFINQKNYTKIAVLYQNMEAHEQQVISLEKKGIVFIRKEKFNMGEKDFKTMLLKIKDSNPEILIMLGYGSHFPLIFKQIEELGMQDVPVLGGLDFLEVPDKNTSIYDNVIFIVPSFNIEPADKSKEFVKQYENEFLNKPTHQAAYVYDTMNLIYLGIIKTDGRLEQTIKYLKELGSYNGVVGEVEILPTGDTKSTLSFARYRDGEIISP